ncbi:5-methyltetrahydropteroyltriglutamate--homocysteine S-methyltransferase [Sulfurimonas sp. HSL3-7]|uniref:5-methyltetrahydropteroyltriglutamate-- homocysteine S-methyltransferase n=1 Tax=Sulfonitrofixus jiaomeiensis TaxID=3131938 RepID=UPI0031F92698
MPKNSVLGFPRIGEKRELKFALENYWSQKCDFSDVEKIAKELKQRHWNYQKEAGIELISCNDFSYYDLMLDTTVMLGAIPSRFRDISDPTDLYFAMARGDKEHTAMQMTKWFNTNYHYIVPELNSQMPFTLNTEKVVGELHEAREACISPKVNLIGPLTYLALAKDDNGTDTLEHFDNLLVLYAELLSTLAQNGAEYVQIDEPIFATDVDAEMLSLLKIAYEKLAKVSDKIKLIVTTYFNHSVEATNVLVHTPVYGIGLDLLYGKKSLESLDTIALSGKQLFAGVIDGRNVWRNDIEKTKQLLETIATHIDREKITIATSCSLLHTPYTLRYEEKLENEVKSWLAFALEKLDEINLLTKLFFNGRLTAEEEAALEENRRANISRQHSKTIHDEKVQKRIAGAVAVERATPYEQRIKIQREELGYADLATTTIGSFPQTTELRQARREFKNGAIDRSSYESVMKQYIDECVAFQESVGLDVLVHGEPERNDMVEYFGEMLEGFAFSQNGWVQSYGSRCVKPPLIFGDVSRPKAMTLYWSQYAQSKTHKHMKGMLTGPVTILNWSFVRDDKPRSEVAKQIAVAISDEVDDLQNGGIKIIQIDEAAFKEGYPLRKEQISAYEKWALESFKISVASADAATQIHTHMCYSNFNDIMPTIEAMGADVITIETARSGNRLLRIFKETGYRQEVGPGIYDIHSPRIPTVDEMVGQIKALQEVLPQQQLWINPDCGLKTRKWEEVRPSLKNMVEAVHIVRKETAS